MTSFREPDLREVPDDGLLLIVQAILSLPGELTREQRKELQAVNREVGRRELAEKARRREEKRRQRAEVRKAVTQIRRKLNGGL